MQVQESPDDAQQQQNRLALAEADLNAMDQLSAEPSRSPSDTSSGSSDMGDLDHGLLSTLSELLQAARAAGIAPIAQSLLEDLMQEYTGHQTPRPGRDANLQTQHTVAAARGIAGALAMQVQTQALQQRLSSSPNAASQTAAPAAAAAAAQPPNSTAAGQIITQAEAQAAKKAAVSRSPKRPAAAPPAVVGAVGQTHLSMQV